MTSREERWRAVAAEVARMPGAAERLLEDHVDDGTGRCAKCSTGGQAGRYIWPCQLCMVAAHALEIRHEG